MWFQVDFTLADLGLIKKISNEKRYQQRAPINNIVTILPKRNKNLEKD